MNQHIKAKRNWVKSNAESNSHIELVGFVQPQTIVHNHIKSRKYLQINEQSNRTIAEYITMTQEKVLISCSYQWIELPNSANPNHGWVVSNVCPNPRVNLVFPSVHCSHHCIQANIIQIKSILYLKENEIKENISRRRVVQSVEVEGLGSSQKRSVKLLVEIEVRWIFGCPE